MSPRSIRSDIFKGLWSERPRPGLWTNRIPPLRISADRSSTESLEKRWRETARAAGVRAKLEPGGTAEDRARWLLDFAVLDLDSLSEGDWLNLCLAAEYFVAPGLSSTKKVVPRTPRTLKPGLRELQKWIVTGLSSLVARATWTVTTKAPVVLGLTPLGLTNIVSHGDAMSFGEAFKTEAYEVLTSTASRFRVCLECRRPFIARKGQEYCSPRCSQAVRTRRFTAKDRELPATGRNNK